MTRRRLLYVDSIFYLFIYFFCERAAYSKCNCAHLLSGNHNCGQAENLARLHVRQNIQEATSSDQDCCCKLTLV